MMRKAADLAAMGISFMLKMLVRVTCQSISKESLVDWIKKNISIKVAYKTWILQSNCRQRFPFYVFNMIF